MDEATEETHAPQISYLSWMISSLGWPSIGLMLVVACFSLAMIWRLYRHGKEPARDVAILLLIPLPLLVGSLLLLGSAIVCLHQIALSKPFSAFVDSLAYTLNMTELTAATFIPVLAAGATALVLLSKRGDGRAPDTNQRNQR